MLESSVVNVIPSKPETRRARLKQVTLALATRHTSVHLGFGLQGSNTTRYQMFQRRFFMAVGCSRGLRGLCFSPTVTQSDTTPTRSQPGATEGGPHASHPASANPSPADVEVWERCVGSEWVRTFLLLTPMPLLPQRRLKIICTQAKGPEGISSEVWKL